jgi:hypothetical protein
MVELLFFDSIALKMAGFPCYYRTRFVSVFLHVQLLRTLFQVGLNSSPQPKVLWVPSGEISGKIGPSPLVEFWRAWTPICYFSANFFAAFQSASNWRWDKEIKNVIRSDGYRRIELLGPYFGGS